MDEGPGAIAAAAARVVGFMDRHDQDEDAVLRNRQILFDWSLAAADYDRTVVNEAAAGFERADAENLWPTSRSPRLKAEEQTRTPEFRQILSERTLRTLWAKLYNEDVPGRMGEEASGFPPELRREVISHAEEGVRGRWLALYSYRERRLREAVGRARAMERQRGMDEPRVPTRIDQSTILAHSSAYALTFRGQAYPLAKGDGADRLVRLLLNPRHEYPAADLLGMSADRSSARAARAQDPAHESSADTSVDAMADQEALADYERRLATIAQESDKARRNNDEAELERLHQEGAFLQNQLLQMRDPRGRPRRLDPEERKRQNSVSVSVNRAVDMLADDLKAFLRAGRLKLESGRNRYEPETDDGPEATFFLLGD